MEDFDISLDEQHEKMREHAEHSEERWVLVSALLSALLAVLAAVSSLYAGHFANKAMLEEIHAANKWSYYQSKGIKAMITEMKGDADSQQKLAGYKQQQEEIKAEANAESAQAAEHLSRHEKLAKAVTAFQIAIGVTAIAVLARRKWFLVLTLMLMLAGIEFGISAFWL